MNKNRQMQRFMFGLLLACGLTTSIGLKSSHAAFVAYTDQTAWQAAVDAVSQNITTLVDFENFTADVNFGAAEPDVVVGGLELSAFSSATFEGKIEVDPVSEAINGNVVVDSGGIDDTDTIDIVLQTPSFAFSFLFENYDNNGVSDEPTLRIGPSGSETVIAAFTGFDGGAFFGIVEDTGATFTDVDFLSTTNQSNGSFFSFDDVRYAFPIPEPTGIALTVLCTIVGLGGQFRSRMKRDC